jgi:hypothetical protein
MNAVEEVGTKTSLLDGAPKVGVRRTDQTHVDFVLSFTADSTNLPGFEHTQQPCLNIDRQLGHLVQKQRAAVRLLERAAVGPRCTSECTAFMSEELAFDQLPGKPSRIDRHERALNSRTALVQDASNVLLAYASLTANQNRPLEPSVAVCLGNRGQHLGRLGDERMVGTERDSTTNCAQLCSADAQHRARTKRVPIDTHTVDPRPVRTGEVTDDQTSTRWFEAAMVTAHCPIR